MVLAERFVEPRREHAGTVSERGQMMARGLVGRKEPRLRFAGIEPRLYRYPAIDQTALAWPLAPLTQMNDHDIKTKNPEREVKAMRHVRTLCGVVCAVVVLAILGARPSEAGKPKAAKKACASNLAACSDQGCGTDFDPNLNKLKNITALDGTPTSTTLTAMMSLEDPVAFTKGGSRDDLAKIGEGKPVVVVAYLLAAKPELGGESCNCGLQTPAETDNHLVLVTKNTLLKFPVPTDETDGAVKEDLATFHSREPESLTAEFTPRVRIQHKNFTREKAQPLIDAADQEALLVRVTGQLLFDSEHFLGHHLVRVNNWEVHPVFKLEYCPTGACTAVSDDGWKSLDDL